MAKKREIPKMPETPTQEELKVVRLALPHDAQRKFRRYAADRETSMAILARRIILEWIDHQERKKQDTQRRP